MCEVQNFFPSSKPARPAGSAVFVIPVIHQVFVTTTLSNGKNLFLSQTNK